MPQTECNHCQESESINQSIKDLDQRIQSENSEIKNSLHFDKKSSATIRKKCGQIIELLQREREREREQNYFNSKVLALALKFLDRTLQLLLKINILNSLPKALKHVLKHPFLKYLSKSIKKPKPLLK